MKAGAGPGARPGGSVALEWAGVSLHLLPGGGVFHAASRSLFLADLHLGKAEFFRRRGVPVPDGDDAVDLARVGALLGELEARRLVVLGDLVHGPESWTPGLVRALADVLPRERVLVAGNHDRLLPPESLGFRIVDEGSGERAAGDEGPELRHVPLPDAPVPLHLAGHLHPVIRLAGGGERLRLPCFVLSGTALILPAWGRFTGGHPWVRRAGDRIFVDARAHSDPGGHGAGAEGRVIEILPTRPALPGRPGRPTR